MKSTARRGAPTVECPRCRRETVFAPSNRWRPFCSQRCKTIDLGAWASDAYAIAGAPADEPGQEGDPPVGADQP
ncbi:MAG TPA: DNA gyrase inhibitor YacG [Burkholderiaceae bacterium]